MHITSERGLIFSTDVVIAFLVLLFCLLSFTIALANYSARIREAGESIYLEEKTIFVADSLVKNFNPENGLLGSCKIDFDKKRVLSNELDSTNFSSIKPLGLSDFFVESVSMRTFGQEKIVFQDKNKSKNCVTIRRFALIDSEKGIVSVKGCLIG